MKIDQSYPILRYMLFLRCKNVNSFLTDLLLLINHNFDQIFIIRVVSRSPKILVYFFFVLFYFINTKWLPKHVWIIFHPMPT